MASELIERLPVEQQAALRELARSVATKSALPHEYLAPLVRVLAMLEDQDAALSRLTAEVERLKAENAMATMMFEELSDKYAEAVEHRRDATTRAQAAEAENARLKEALRPFAGKKLPSTRQTEVAYDEHGLRRLMSPMEIATLAARQALGETT